MRVTRGKYSIALRGGGFEEVTGWVCGEWGARKGRWFWEFTDPDGMLRTEHPSIENKNAAMAKLVSYVEGA